MTKFKSTDFKTAADAKSKRSDINEELKKLEAFEADRELTPEEEKRFDDLQAQWESLNPIIDRLEIAEKRALTNAAAQARISTEDKEKRELQQYSLKRVLEAGMNKRQLDGLELEMHQEAEKEARESGISVSGIGVPKMIISAIAEKRAMTATGTTSTSLDQGGMLIPIEKSGLLMALRPMLVLSQLGADFMGGLVGNLEFIKGSSTVAAWNTETGTADETNVATSKVTMSPKRLAAYTDISKQLMVQTPETIEAKVWGDLLRAVAQEVERAAINGSGTSNQPRGILNTSNIGSVVGGGNGADPTWDHLVELERAIAIQNALMGRLGYLTNYKVKAKLKTTKIDTGSGLFVWPQNASELNGYPVAASNLVPSNLTKGNQNQNCSAIIFGDFSELKIGNWGGIDLVVDPLTLARNNQIRIVTNSFWDVAVVWPEKFAAMVDAKTGDPSVTTAAGTTLAATTVAPTTTL